MPCEARRASLESGVDREGCDELALPIVQVLQRIGSKLSRPNPLLHFKIHQVVARISEKGFLLFQQRNIDVKKFQRDHSWSGFCSLFQTREKKPEILFI